jgi:hypothetical protein
VLSAAARGGVALAFVVGAGADVTLTVPSLAATVPRAWPERICWAAKATVRRPEPQTWLMPNAVLLSGMPARRAAWRAGFWPCPAVRTWPRMTSSISPASNPARLMAERMAASPSRWAGSEAKAPLKLPTGVRRAAVMTTSVMAIFLWQCETSWQLMAEQGLCHRFLRRMCCCAA